jgi:hypothetical protein
LQPLGRSELAQLAGVSRGTVRRLEDGGLGQPRGIERLADVLDSSAKYLAI